MCIYVYRDGLTRWTRRGQDAALMAHRGQQAARRRKQKASKSSRGNPAGRPGPATMYSYRRGLLGEAFGGVARTLFCGHGVVRGHWYE